MNRLCIYICIVAWATLVVGCSSSIEISEQVDTLPPIVPDYIGVTLPSTIAPIAFTLNQEFDQLHLVVADRKGESFQLSGSSNPAIPSREWRRMLKNNIGDSISLTLSVQQNGIWRQYQPFTIHVSPFDIDYGLVYRLIAPGYELYSKMGIYERSLSDFTEKPLVVNTQVPQSCVNCHAFKQTDPGYMNLHIRGAHGGTLLRTPQMENDFEIFQFNCTLNTQESTLQGGAVYPYWHPSGKYIAYSVNQTRQMFHEQHNKRVEVVDVASDVVVFDVESNKLLSSPLLTSADFETFPAFSPDGRTLYFCRADHRILPQEYHEVRYNLCSIGFDPQTGEFGKTIDTLVCAASQNKSVSFPRPSYDGRYLMYTLSDYGNFSIWHREADLWLYNLSAASTRSLDEVNSNDTESYHSWSSNSRWFVFASRRDDGLYTRLYIASIDPNGRVTKPFVLPQSTAMHDTENLYSYNIPEFVLQPVQIDAGQYKREVAGASRREVTHDK